MIPQIGRRVKPKSALGLRLQSELDQAADGFASNQWFGNEKGRPEGRPCLFSF
jgi:hypothetical protein